MSTHAYNIETAAIHGGTSPEPVTLSRAPAVYRTPSFVFKSTEHAANLFALKVQSRRYGVGLSAINVCQFRIFL